MNPFRIGGNEYWCRELSKQLGEGGWRSVLCFEKAPAEFVREFLALPNVSIEVVENCWENNARAAKQLWRILRRYQPEILHRHFTGLRVNSRAQRP